MTTVWLALRADVRRRWLALLSLAVLLGLIGGVVLSPHNPGQVNLMSSPDGAMGVSVDRVKILPAGCTTRRHPGRPWSTSRWQPRST